MKIFLIGFMGSGKTFWGRALSEKLGMRFFDLDEQVAEQAGKTIPALFADEGEEHFRKLEKEILHIITESHDTFIMACGGGTPCYFNNIEYMNGAGTTVWINPPPEKLFERLVHEKGERPLIKDLADEQLRSYISRKFADRRIYYEQAKLVMSEEEIQIDKLINHIFHV